MIEVSEQTIDKIHAILAGVEKADEKVLKPALARGLMAGKTAAGSMVRQTYHISAGDFNRYGHIRFDRVSPKGNSIIGSIEYAGSVIPLVKFKVTPRVPAGGKIPSAAVLKASSLVPLDKGAFLAQMQSGHIGVFQRVQGEYSKKNRGQKRKTKYSEKLEELYSPPVPKMVGNEMVMEDVERRVNEVVNQRINHEIERLLNG